MKAMYMADFCYICENECKGKDGINNPICDFKCKEIYVGWEMCKEVSIFAFINCCV
jgi:hypothetical protein